MKKLILLLAITLSFTSQAEPQLSGSPDELKPLLLDLKEQKNPVAISGQHETSLQAANAIVTLKITTEDKSMEETLAENQKIRGEVTSALLASGIDKDRIATSQFSSIPETGSFTGKVRSYRITNALKITIQTDEQLLAIAREVDRRDGVEFNSMTPDFANREAQQSEALQKALEDALAKKRIFEETLGIKLTLQGFEAMKEESGRAERLARSRAMIEARTVKPKSGLMLSTSEATAAPSNTGFGQMTFKQVVLLEFLISDR